MKNKHFESELSPEVMALLDSFDEVNIDPDDDTVDDAWLDSFCEDRFGGEF